MTYELDSGCFFLSSLKQEKIINETKLRWCYEIEKEQQSANKEAESDSPTSIIGSPACNNGLYSHRVGESKKGATFEPWGLDYRKKISYGLSKSILEKG